MTDYRPTSELRVRSRAKAFLDKGRRLERMIKYYIKHSEKREEYEPTYQLIVDKYPGVPTKAEVAQLLTDLKGSRVAGEERVYQYWHQGCTPEKAAPKAPWHPVHKISALSYEKYEKDRHTVLDYDSLHDYINVPDKFIEKLEKAGRYPMIADFVRCMLLFVNGGVWSDLTVVAFNKIPHYVWERDLFLYVRADRPSDYREYLYFDWGTYSWDAMHKVRITPGFCHCTKENVLMGQWLLKFMEVVEGEGDRFVDLHYYIFLVVFDYLVRNDKDFSDNFIKLSSYPSDVLMHYLVVYCSKAFNEADYNMVKSKIPIQRIKLSTRFFEGCMAYESLVKEGW